MINQDINNLKVVMRDYVTNNLGLSKISNYSHPLMAFLQQ
jgi:hypothetical protein